ncbi:NACHT domain-containing protein [Actinomadura decatromicini]|nr:NACHT domain-containing protein [Actinomadura decatromicini]
MAAGLVVVAGLLVWMFAAWRAKGLQTSVNVAALIAVLLAVPTLVVGLVSWWWRQRGPSPVTDADTLAAAKDALAVMVAAQWREEARIRELDDPAPIPIQWELTSDPRIMDHPAHITAAAVLTWTGTGDQISEMAGRFRTLRRRRLVIVGGPGSGKTTLAVQLVRELLDHPNPDDPVPVLVSIADWDTERFPRLQGWLAARLTETYPSLRAPQYGTDAPVQLVQRAHVLPVLDGLDEIPAQARTNVIAALNRSLADHDQLILTSRTREYTDATLARDVVTSAAVIQPQPLTADTAADHLDSCLPPIPPPGWADTLHQIRTGGAPHLTSFVSNPLGLWLLRTTHITTRIDPTPLTDPTRYPTPQHLQAHLFDQLIPALIHTRPPSTDPADLFRLRHRHDPDHATRWLGYLAHLLDTVPTRDLAWWRLAATSHTPISRLARLAFGIATGIAFGCTFEIVFGLISGIVFGLVSAIGIGIGAHEWAQETPGYARLEITGRKGLLVRRLAAGLAAGFAAGPWAVLAFGLSAWVETPAATGRANTPVATWRADRALHLLRACTFGLAGGLTFGLWFRPEFGFEHLGGFAGGLGAGVAAGLTLGLASGKHHAWLAYLIATCWLARQHRLPRSLMAFLDDAHRLGLLRTVGPVYQFRHAEFHDHLAATYLSPQDH